MNVPIKRAKVAWSLMTSFRMSHRVTSPIFLIEAVISPLRYKGNGPGPHHSMKGVKQYSHDLKLPELDKND